MDEDNQTLNTDPGTDAVPQNVPAAEGSQNDVVEQTTTPTLSLDEINTLTGHNYANVAEARKGLDNLKRAVGKKEVVKEVVPQSLVEQVRTLQNQVAETNFYTEHPELKPHREILSKFGNPHEAIKDPVVQKVLEAVAAREETDSAKLKSNSRITQSSPDFNSDLESVTKTGDWVSFLKKHKGVEF